jgi:hypothetical protein
MRDSNRIPVIMGKIEQIWKQYPDMRFGQLVFNLYAAYAQDVGVHQTFHPKWFNYTYIEDDGFLNWLNTFKGWSDNGKT